MPTALTHRYYIPVFNTTGTPLYVMSFFTLDTACMAIKMTFKELFDHLKTYIRDPDQRWKHVMRAKRDLDDYSGFGGTGKDQSYFTGKVCMHACMRHLIPFTQESYFLIIYRKPPNISPGLIHGGAYIRGLIYGAYIRGGLYILTIY